MPTESSQEVLQRMESQLSRCRRQILFGRLAASLLRGLDFFAALFLCIGAFFLLFRMLLWVTGTETAFAFPHLLLVTAACATAILLQALWRGLWSSPIRDHQAAERLDLAQETHNRIATAMALLKSSDNSPFARAAIQDGRQCLERLQEEKPWVERMDSRGSRRGLFLGLGLLFALAGILFQGIPDMGPADQPIIPVTTATKETSPPEAPRPGNRTGKKPRVISPGDPDRTGKPRTAKSDPDARDKNNDTQPDHESRSEGPEGEHASSLSRNSRSSSSSRGASSGMGLKSEPGNTEPAKKKKPSSSKKKVDTPPKLARKNKEGGSINARGSSGAGSMRTAQNEWSSKVKAKANNNDEFEQEEEPDEKPDSDKQRLGMQPSLKNRTSRISRELSLSMGNKLNKNQQKGRGGPSAPKKSRGTATMIMGVPVPGFVKGRLLPGPTKSIQEKVEPSPRKGKYATVSRLPEARPEEDPQERYRPSASLGIQARDYLIQYHAEKEKNRNGSRNDSN